MLVKKEIRSSVESNEEDEVVLTQKSKFERLYSHKRNSNFCSYHKRIKIQQGCTQISDCIYKTLTILSQGHLNKRNNRSLPISRENLFQALSINFVLFFSPRS